MKKIIIFSIFLLALPKITFCNQLNTIELTDGSVIKGEVVSLDNEIYTLNAGSLGEIKVNASEIKNIQLTNNTTPAPTVAENLNTSNIEIKSEMAKYQTAALSNPDIMKAATELASDPQVQAILNDPQVLEAIKSGNLQVLATNPKIMSLMNNPKIKEIQNKFQQKTP